MVKRSFIGHNGSRFGSISSYNGGFMDGWICGKWGKLQEMLIIALKYGVNWTENKQNLIISNWRGLRLGHLALTINRSLPLIKERRKKKVITPLVQKEIDKYYRGIKV